MFLRFPCNNFRTNSCLYGYLKHLPASRGKQNQQYKYNKEKGLDADYSKEHNLKEQQKLLHGITDYITSHKPVNEFL